MLKKIIFAGILFTVSVLFIQSCVQSVVDNRETAPTITLLSPLTGDSVKVGKTQISYEAADKVGGTGLDHYDVIVNGEATAYLPDSTEAVEYLPLYLIVGEELLNESIAYAVTVYNKDGDAATSETQTVFVKINTDPPDAPTNLSLTKISANAVNLKWEDNSDNEQYFQVWRKDGANQIYRSIKLLEEETISVDDLDLSPYITYYYKVRAINSYGESDFSNEVNSTGSTGGDTPSNLRAEALGASSVYLTWVDNGANTLGFILQRLDGGETTWNEVATLPRTPLEYTDEGLIGGTPYKYRIKAYTGTVQSDWSNIASVSTYSTDVPAPQNLEAAFNSSTRHIDITWNDNTQFEVGTVVQRKSGGSGSWATLGDVDADVTIFVDSGITVENTYYYRARHIATEGFYTQFSNEDSAYVPELPPLAPVNLEILKTSNPGEFTLYWEVNSKDEDGLELQRKTGTSGEFVTRVILDPGSLAFSDTVPDTNEIYWYRIRAFRDSDFSDFSNEVSTAGGTGNIMPPTSLVGEVVEGEVKVNLTWQDNSDNELLFEVERKADFTGSSWTRIAVIEANSTSYQDAEGSGVYRGEGFWYRVRAKNTQGVSGYSNEYLVEIPF